MADASG
jgi:hypothetical protein